MHIRLALVCAISVAAMASAAAAQPDRVATEVFVSDAGVDFSDAASTAAFYASLKKAASAACDSGMSQNLTIAARDRACAAQSLDRAVATMGKPSLMALHSRKTGKVTTTVLAAQ